MLKIIVAILGVGCIVAGEKFSERFEIKDSLILGIILMIFGMFLLVISMFMQHPL